MPTSDEERFKLDYKDIGDLIRHYSTVRSALTTFLLTVGVAAFSAWFHRQQSSPFFIVAGHLFLLISAVVCLIFSYRTEDAILHQIAIWKWSKGEPPEGASYPARETRWLKPAVWVRVCRDWMNILLLVVIVGIIVSFWLVTAPEADHFARAVVAVLTLFTCLTAVAIFLIVSVSNVSASNKFLWPTVSTVALATVTVAVAFFLLRK